MTDYSRDFLGFLRDLIVVEGAYGPRPIVPPFLETWLGLAFPAPDGNPAARNILDIRTKKQGKSSLAAAVAIYLASRTAGAEVVICAADRDQAADRVLRACKYAAENGPLARHAKVYRDVIELDSGGLIKALGADWRGAAGGNYSGVIFDELHAWTWESDRRRFDELTIPPTVAHGCRWVASYAGHLGESLLLKELWDRCLAGERIGGELPIYQDKGASMLGFIDTGPESWRMPWMSDEYIEATRASERPNTFRRLWLNEWTSSESQFLPENAWENCRDDSVQPLRDGDRRRIVLGADASTSRDCTALVGLAWNRSTKQTEVVYTRTWKPTRGILRLGKPTVDLAATIGAEVMRLHKAGQLAAVIADPYQLHTLIVEWEKAGIRVIELAQNAGRVESDQGLYDAIVAGKIAHYGDPVLTEHLRAAVAVETPRGLRLAKQQTSQKIDAAVALSMGYWGASRMLVGQDSARVQMLPDPWETPTDVYNNNILTFPDGSYSICDSPVNKRPHPPGVTWHNCPHRRHGCQVCVDEQDQDGSFWEAKARDAEIVEAIEMGTYGQQAEQRRLDQIQQQELQIGRQQNDASIRERFWKHARRGQS